MSACCSSTPRTRPRSRLYRGARLRDQPHRPRRTGGHSREPLRTRPATSSTTCSPRWGEPRYRVDQVWDGLYAQRQPLDDVTTLSARAPRPARRRAPARVRARRSRPPRPTASPRSGCGRPPRRRRRSRPCSMRSTRPGHGVRVVAGRLRDGVHVLRDGPGRLRPPPRRRRDRRAGRARAARLAAACVQRGVHGDGRAARELRRRRGLRSNGCTATSGSRRATSRSAPSAWCPGCGGSRPKPLPVTLAVSLHAPDDELREHARPAEPPVPDRRGARRRGRGAPGPTGGGSASSTPRIAGVNDRPDQAEALGPAARPLARRRRGAREPDPAQPHRRLPGSGHAARLACGRSPTASRRFGVNAHDPPQPGRRHRRGLRPAPDTPGLRRYPPRVSPSGQNGRVNDRKFVNQFQPQTLVHRDGAALHQRRLRLPQLLPPPILSGRHWPRPATASPTRSAGATASRSPWPCSGSWSCSCSRGDVFGFPLILTLMFDVALVALLAPREPPVPAHLVQVARRRPPPRACGVSPLRCGYPGAWQRHSPS